MKVLRVCSWLTVFLLLSTISLRAGNLLPNGSFEIGAGKWIGWDNGQRNGVMVEKFYGQVTLEKTGLISRDQAKFGRQSFCLNFPGFIQSQYIKLDKNKKYTFSLFAKGDTDNEKIAISLESSYRTGTGHGDRLVSASASRTIGQQWERLQVTTSLPESRNGYYKLKINHVSNGTVWLDGAQIEEGETISDYQPAEPAEIGLTGGREAASNLFLTGEPIPVRAQICISEKTAPDLKILYTLFDYRGKKIREISRPLAADPDGYAADNFSLTPDYKGLLSLVAEIRSGEKVLTRGELVFGVISPARPPDVKADQDSPLGTHVMNRWQVDLAEKLGFRWQRNWDFYDRDGSLIWLDVEPEKGKFVFRDAGIDRYLKQGFNVMGVFQYAPKWALKHPDDIKAGWGTHLPDLDMWRRYVRETVTHFKGRVEYWEVWNEPFTSGSWADTPENYFELLKATAEEARKADPGCKIVGGCLAPLDYASTRSFMNRLFASGGLKYMDVLSIHALGGFMTPNGPNLPEDGLVEGKPGSAVFKEITDLMRAYGSVKPIWNSETDVWCQPSSRLYPFADDTPWNKEYPPMPGDLAADYLVQLTAVSLANNAPKSFLYYFGGGRYEEADSSQMLITGHMALKSTTVAAAEILRQFYQPKFYKELNWGGVARCYLFQTADGPLAVAWGLRTWRQPGRLSLPSGSGGFTYFDVAGNPRDGLTREGDTVSLDLTTQPIYIRTGKMPDLEKVLSGAKISGLIPEAAGKAVAKEPALQKELNYVSESEPVKGLTAYAFGRGDGAVCLIISTRDDTPAFSLRKITGMKVRLINEDIDISEKQADRVKFEVETTPVVVEAPKTTPAALLSSLSQAEINGLREFNLEGIWPTSVPGGKLNLTFRLQNIGRNNVKPTLNIRSLPEAAVVKSTMLALPQLKPGEKWQGETGLKNSRQPEELNGRVEIEVTGGAESTKFQRPINLAYALKTQKPIIIDGNLGDWTPEGFFNLNRKDQVVIGQSLWKGELDLSARVRARWDNQFLYLGLEVKDDFVQRRKEAMQLWDGTSVEIFIDANQLEDLGVSFYNRDDFQILFGPASREFPEDIWGFAPYSGRSGFSGVNMKTAKTATGYNMEIALPREMFDVDMLPGALKGQYGAGMSIGLSVVASDRAADSEGRKSSIVWGGTVLNYLDVSKFGTLVFLP